MMRFRHIYRRLRHPLVLFGATATVLLGTLTWLAWHTLQQDQALVDQRIQERLDNTADLVAAALRDKFSDVEEQLTGLAGSPDSNLAEAFSLDKSEIDNEALIAVVEHGNLEVYPRVNLRYYPVLPAPAEAKADVFAPGEYDEFRREDYASAAAAYEKLVSSADEATRAGALVRLGRVLRKANDPHSALDVYRQLAESGIGSVDGLPAELLARHARCVLLDELDQVPELQKEAHLLWSGLHHAKWPLTPSAYRFYEKKAFLWLGSDPLPPGTSSAQPDGALALAGAVEELWRLWQRIQQGAASPAGQRSFWAEGIPVFLMWRGSQDRLAALVAQPGYLEKEWMTPVVQRIVEQQGVRLALADAEVHPVLGAWADGNAQQALRTSVQAQLPWTLQVTSVDPGTFMAEMKAHRRLFWGGLAAMASLVLAAGYAIVRSVARELKVARLQGDFVSAVSHEFRTPLASLCHLSELLAEGRVPTDQRRREYYQALRRESERLHRLVESILDFRRMEVGAREYGLEGLDAAALVRAVAEEFAQEVQDRGYAVEIQVEKSLPRLRADREALSRAIWNLLDNSVKYSPDCRTVGVQASCAGDRVAICVRDHGLGIARSEQGQIFEKFFRASSAKAAGVRGTGLGLAMVRQIVTAHGGRLHVESRPGAGSTFTIFLPFERDSE
jgi:signal transduction histidine kinase